MCGGCFYWRWRVDERAAALALAEIDRRYGALRLAAPQLLRQLRGSVQRKGSPSGVVSCAGRGSDGCYSMASAGAGWRRSWG